MPALRHAVRRGQDYCLECGARLPASAGSSALLGRSWRRRLGWYPGDWIWPALLALVIAAVAGTASALWLADRSDAGDATVVGTRPAPRASATTQTAPEPTTDHAHHDGRPRRHRHLPAPANQLDEVAGGAGRLDDRPRLGAGRKGGRGQRRGAAGAAQGHEEGRRPRLVQLLESAPGLFRRFLRASTAVRPTPREPSSTRTSTATGRLSSADHALTVVCAKRTGSGTL